MLNIFNIYKQEFHLVAKKISSERNIIIDENSLNNFSVEPSKDKSHGDLACNIAMILSKNFALTPRELASLLIDKLNNSPDSIFVKNVNKFEIAGPGFINIFINNKIFYKLLEEIISKKELDFINIGQGTKVNLEYASPNPTGPIHVGHTRGAIYGDVLAKLLQKVGYDVLKEYYINDAGVQINNLVKSAYLRYLECFGKEITITNDLYPGEYLIEIGQKLKNNFQDKLLNKEPDEYFSIIRNFVIDEMLEIIKSDLLALGIKHDNYFSEKKNLHDNGRIDETIKILQNNKLVYVGKLEAPKTEKGVGLTPEDYDEKDQVLFKSSLFGDDQDRVIKKADGTPTYFASDLAYIRSKFERGAKIFIMPLGYDHAGYVKRLSAAVLALTNNQATLKVILCQMVKFVKDGKPLKMSKRAGNFITARQVIDEVGPDVLRFLMLTRKNDAPFDFDLSKVIEQSKDNPIFYVQYAHARCCSVLRNLFLEIPILAKKIFPKNDCNFDEVNINFSFEKKLELLQDESEINLIKKIANFSRIIEMSAINFEPHRIAFYLQELSSEFHALWNKGSENKDLKFIIKNNLDLTEARILLILAVKKIIFIALDIFNINALEEMK